MTAITLYIARHGQTHDNVAGVISKPDVELTNVGEQQARALAQDIKNRGINLDQIVSSPIHRTMHTAQIIADELGGVGITQDDRLTEGNFKLWESRSIDDFDAHFGSTDMEWDKYLELDFGGEIESFKEMCVRLKLFLCDNLELLSTKKVLLVSHNQTIKSLQKLLYGYCDNHSIHNSELYVMEVEDIEKVL